MNASVSLYLSISLSLVLSLICYTIESCHLDAILCRAEGISYLSEDSLFSNYCLPLYDYYGIFALNEQGLDLENLLLSYAKKNCETPKRLSATNTSLLSLGAKDVDISSYTYLTDNDGEVFVEQVMEYVKYLEIDNAINELQNLSSTKIPAAFSQTEDGVPNIDFNDIDSSIFNEYVDESISRTGETTEDLSDINCGSFLTDIIATVNHHIEYSLLACIIPDPSSVSTATVEKLTLPSVTCQLSEEGINMSYGYYTDEGETTLEKAAFCEYIYHTFGCYTSPGDDKPLKYEMEYIISGQDSDDANLINSAYQLIALRSGLNLIHLLTDSDKFNAAWSIARSATAIPGLPYIIQATILTVWSTAEAVLDVRDLLSGKKVPLLKNADQWNLSIKGLLNFSKNSVSSNNNDEGLTYSRYLEMLMATQNNISLRYRTMDLIQMDLCNAYNENFRISRCVTGIRATITYALPSLFTMKGYSYSANLSFNYN